MSFEGYAKLQGRMLLHMADEHMTWKFRVNPGRRELAVPYCPAFVWFMHAACVMRNDYKAVCAGRPSLHGYRAYLRRECLRDINHDPGLLPWFEDFTADTWKRRTWGGYSGG
jgi:hypothetical protein